MSIHVAHQTSQDSSVSMSRRTKGWPESDALCQVLETRIPACLLLSSSSPLRPETLSYDSSLLLNEGTRISSFFAVPLMLLWLLLLLDREPGTAVCCPIPHLGVTFAPSSSSPPLTHTCTSLFLWLQGSVNFSLNLRLVVHLHKQECTLGHKTRRVTVCVYVSQGNAASSLLVAVSDLLARNA